MTPIDNDSLDKLLPQTFDLEDKSRLLKIIESFLSFYDFWDIWQIIKICIFVLVHQESQRGRQPRLTDTTVVK